MQIAQNAASVTSRRLISVLLRRMSGPDAITPCTVGQSAAGSVLIVRLLIRSYMRPCDLRKAQMKGSCCVYTLICFNKCTDGAYQMY